ncbi:hypothetical protein GCM10022219_11590 [Microbacterium oryzae]|uniref:Uncharacterized protein n=1 Tax=Microbacterium oryzae TaxID=743009 RepID=A0A6I6EA30_9MICO|nr:hypothetical protein [Microbacterium oryzae]QGU28471.1 hypothetical protein D7D94_12915 [Microbacterium oryzae]
MFEHLTSRERSAINLALQVTRHQKASPTDLRDTSAWVGEFREIGFFSAVIGAFADLDGEPTMLGMVDFSESRPRVSVRLFRVCDPGREASMFWSANVGDLVDCFAKGGSSALVKHPNARLFSAVVPAERVLAVINGWEWIIDPSWLVVFDHGPVATLPNMGVTVQELPDSPERRHYMEQGFGHLTARRKPQRSLWFKTEEPAR